MGGTAELLLRRLWRPGGELCVMREALQRVVGRDLAGRLGPEVVTGSIFSVSLTEHPLQLSSSCTPGSLPSAAEIWGAGFFCGPFATTGRLVFTMMGSGIFQKLVSSPQQDSRLIVSRLL